MMKTPVAILILLLTHVLEAKDLQAPARCHIKVHILNKNKETNELDFHLHLKSKESCEQAAKKHETNFDPHIIEKVSVEYNWK